MIRSFALVMTVFGIGASGQGRDPNAACTLCAGPSDEPNLNPTFVPFSQGNNLKSCEDLLAELPQTIQSDSTCKDLQLYAYQRGCCVNPPYEYCSICPDGSPFVNTNLVPLGLAGDPRCDEMQYRWEALNGVFVPGTCDDTFLRRGAFYCGCPNVQQQCSLCKSSDGGVLPGSSTANPRKGDAFVTQTNCIGIEYFFSIFTAAECDSAADGFGVDLAAFCECPGSAVNETASSCELCPGGGTLENPNAIWTTAQDTFERTCAQAENFAQFVIEDQVCDSFMSKPRSVCKCKGGRKNSGASPLKTFIPLLALGVIFVQSFFM